eukprot:TRINITY_DN7737_c1_g1_i2.p1 TRINITY_DN7737_c1_g1~~TRINITY_DN7737_c1_g1_i2.p1  ORF type:complete len:274 (-),score=37.83 TRINITY_DN7737_c1_g1_i2:334-1155(-)
MLQTLDLQLWDLLDKTSVTAIATPHLETVQGTDSVLFALEKMSKKHLLCLPVLNELNQHGGWIDVLDILCFIFEGLGEGEAPPVSEVQLYAYEKKLRATFCSQIGNMSTMNPFARVINNTNLLVTIRAMVHNDLKRISVVDPNDQLVGIVSQMDVVHYLSKVMHKFSAGKIPVSKLLTNQLRVINYITKENTALDAFVKMKKTNINSLPIVIEERDKVLCGNLSASDMQYMGILLLHPSFLVIHLHFIFLNHSFIKSHGHCYQDHPCLHTSLY